MPEPTPTLQEEAERRQQTGEVKNRRVTKRQGSPSPMLLVGYETIHVQQPPCLNIRPEYRPKHNTAVLTNQVSKLNNREVLLAIPLPPQQQHMYTRVPILCPDHAQTAQTQLVKSHDKTNRQQTICSKTT